MVERLVVERADDETKSLLSKLATTIPDQKKTPSPRILKIYLSNSINSAADSQDALSRAALVIRDGALGLGHLANLSDILTALTDDCSSFSRCNQRTDMDPLTLVNRRLLGRLLSLLGSVRNMSVILGTSWGVRRSFGRKRGVIAGLRLDRSRGRRRRALLTSGLVKSGPLGIVFILNIRGR